VTANVATDSKTSGGGIQDAESTWKNPGFASTDVHPVMNVRRGDVQKFCTELSRWDEQTYRLPTEAEWEYSGMTGTSTLWANGDNPEVTAQIGNVAYGTLKTRFRHFSQFCINVDDDGPHLKVSKRITRGSAQQVAALRKKSLCF